VRITALGLSFKYIPDSYLTFDYLPFLIAGVEVLTDVVAYPLHTACTRLVAQKGETKYKGIIDVLEKIPREDKSSLTVDEVDIYPFKPEWYAGFAAHALSTVIYATTDVVSRMLFDKAFGLGGDIVNVLNVQRFRPVPVVRYDADKNDIVVESIVTQVDVSNYVVTIRNPLCYAIGTIAAYPFKQISIRMQAGDPTLKGMGTFEALQNIIEVEGWKGVFRGLLFN
jgi:hypothetical protein